MAKNIASVKSNYIIRAKKFIAMITPFLPDYNDPDGFRNAVTMFNRCYHRKVIVSCGLTRIALITSDYVIKIDYNPYEIKTFGGCENECRLYRQAKKCGFDYLLAAITKVVYEGRKFYIMPRIYGIGRTKEDAWKYMTEEEFLWFGNRVADLHNLNYGWKNGRIVIIDYSARPF